jgi:hypothetical protein
MRLSRQALLSLIAIGLAVSALYLAVARTTSAGATPRASSAAAAGNPAGSAFMHISRLDW